MNESNENIVWWPFDEVAAFMQAGFEAVGLPAADAAISTEVLIAADRRGVDSHGVGRFKPIYLDRILAGTQEATTRIDIVRETPTTAVLDGNNGMGHVVAKKAMEMAIAKAKANGLGMTVVRNSTHYGAAFYYADMAIREGMIGLTGTNARPSIAPTWGVEPMLGTNPMTWGMPSDEPFPFLLDCATSVTQRGKIELYERLGKDLPDGWVIGQDGSYRHDTKQVLKDFGRDLAALTPLGGLGEDLGGYKGYGYATVVEILSTALSQAQFLKALSGIDADGKPAPIKLGHFFMAMQVEAFVDLADFKRQVGEICRALRASKKAPGAERIWTPGEKEWEIEQYRKGRGVPFNEALKTSFRAVNEQLKLGRRLPF